MSSARAEAAGPLHWELQTGFICLSILFIQSYHLRDALQYYGKRRRSYSEEFSKSADALKLTAEDLLGFKIIDGIIPEPLGGAHRNPEAVAKNISEIIMQSIEELGSKSGGKLTDERYKRLRRIGSFDVAEA